MEGTIGYNRLHTTLNQSLILLSYITQTGYDFFVKRHDQLKISMCPVLWFGTKYPQI